MDLHLPQLPPGPSSRHREAAAPPTPEGAVFPSSPLGGGGGASPPEGASSPISPSPSTASSSHSATLPLGHSATSSLPPLSDHDAAIFEAWVAKEPLTAAAKRLNTTYPKLLAAFTTAPIRDYIAFHEQTDARRKTLSATDALEELLTTTEDPVEKRRAASHLLRYFRTPLTGATARGQSPRSGAAQHSAPSTQHSGPSTQDSPPSRAAQARATKQALAERRELYKHDPYAGHNGDPLGQQIVSYILGRPLDPLPEKPREFPRATPEDCAAAAEACAKALDTLKVGGAPTRMRLHEFHAHLHSDYQRAHQTRPQFILNTESPLCFLHALIQHWSLTIDPPEVDKTDSSQVNCTVHVLKPKPVDYYVNMVREKDRGWVISGIIDFPEEDEFG